MKKLYTFVFPENPKGDTLWYYLGISCEHLNQAEGYCDDMLSVYDDERDDDNQFRRAEIWAVDMRGELRILARATNYGEVRSTYFNPENEEAEVSRDFIVRWWNDEKEERG